jgi:hypothetical protein
MPHLNHHPAIGFGDLMDGWFVVPQNPLMPGGTPLVPSVQAAMGGRVSRRSTLAELMPGGFTIPQNPLRQALGGLRSIGCGGSSGCGGSVPTASYTLNGLGQLDTSSVSGFFSSIPEWLTEPSAIFPGVSNWVLLAGGAIALDLYLGKRGRR